MQRDFLVPAGNRYVVAAVRGPTLVAAKHHKSGSWG